MWKTIYFEDNYEISDEGKIRNSFTGKLKSTRFSKNGYERVTLYPSGKTYFVHQLVAKVFIGDYHKDNLVINHKDGVKRNNSLSNLEWVTYSENSRHALDNNLYVPVNMDGVNNPKAKFTKECLIKIDSLHNEGFTVSEIAKEMNVPYERVRRYLKGESYSK